MRGRRSPRRLAARGGGGTAAAAAGAAGSAAPQPQRSARPRSIADVDNSRLLGFAAELAEDHPGWGDAAYCARREQLGRAAAAHEVGEPLPAVEYSADERRVWAAVLGRLRPLLERHACREYLDGFAAFNFSPHEPVQLQAASDVLQAHTGWALRPVAGLMHPRDFLAGLAFRHFHSTQYVRHGSRPEYTPEPDLVHEALGHLPMLLNPDFAAMAQAIGEASLDATEAQIWHLTKVYWYTVEFGVVREGAEHKAFGAGILSSIDELEHFGAGRAEFAPFNPSCPQPKMSYKDGVQQRYFVLDGFREGTRQLRAYAAAHGGAGPPPSLSR